MSKKIIKMKLHPKWGTHLGHCQITYVSRNDKGERLVYCLQQNFEDIRLMRCSEDGEPSHEVSFSDALLDFESPKGDSKLETKARDWITKYTEGLEI